MNKKFLDIIKKPSEDKSCSIDELREYYHSEDLIKDLNSLICNRIPCSQIQGKKILIKPNWVRHEILPDDEFCLRTHDSFVIAVLKIILEMRPAEVLIADAPIQGCDWGRMITSSFISEINRFEQQFKIPIIIRDLRRRTFSIKDNSPESSLRPLLDYIIFDLGKESKLEPITIQGKPIFRVTNYDPERMSYAHAPGIHKYCIAKEFFESDVVISLPKIKTHQKTGLTGALKNIVGINGDKDFLPHHRLGGTGRGGDCYPGNSYMRYWSELVLDCANRRQGKKAFRFYQKLSSLLWILSWPGPEHNIAAGWYGNDTTWRMVADLNRIALFGMADGTVSGIQQRQILSICDAIIAGQGDGPLNPKPLPLGMISLTNCASLNDLTYAILMQLPIQNIALLNNYSANYLNCNIITINNSNVGLEDIKKQAVATSLPVGWLKC
jgi:uncharacterized protein (DUF362 family)